MLDSTSTFMGFHIVLALLTMGTIAQAAGAAAHTQQPLVSAATQTPYYTWKSIQYSAVVGFFAQGLPGTDEKTFDYVSSNFGLLDTFQVQGLSALGYTEADATIKIQDNLTSAPPWPEFKSAIKSLNLHAPENVRYKVLYLARHGQGYHNVAEGFYGTHLWDCYWSHQDGNGTVSWSDALLTRNGISEAETAHQAWKTQITHDVPLPQVYFSSPLRRAANTLLITWQDLTLTNATDSPHPIIKEKLREAIGIHTCDRRSKRSFLEKQYSPTFHFPPLCEFPEDDPLWSPIYRESHDARRWRLKQALDEIFSSKEGIENDFISVTAHSGTIASILEVIGHREFALATGAMIPVVVRVEYSPNEQKIPAVSPPVTAPTCTVDPIAAAAILDPTPLIGLA